jgi:hypothetical protein
LAATIGSNHWLGKRLATGQIRLVNQRKNRMRKRANQETWWQREVLGK